MDEKTMIDALRRIVSLATWDKQGAVAPDLPVASWESTARLALDIARAALVARVENREFIQHDEEGADGFSDWVTPKPYSYLMKCCDCGLVHEAQFRVAQFQPRPSEEFEVVADPDLQAQFRMRRAET